MMDTFDHQLAREGVDPDQIGQAYAARAYPLLDRLAPLDAYGLGFRDGLAAGLRLVPLLMARTVDGDEAIALLCDPDALPMLVRLSAELAGRS